MARRPTGGKGSNQYQQRGTAKPKRSAEEIASTLEVEAAAWAFAGKEKAHVVTRKVGRTQDGLIRMAAHPDLNVRMTAARDKRSPPELLVLLAEDAKVGGAALRNPGCPTESLLRAASLHQHEVSILANPAAPPEAFTVIFANVYSGGVTDDDAERMRRVAAQNPACPSEVLEQIAGDIKNKGQVDVAAHPNCPPALLAEMVSGRFRKPVREAAAANPNLPVEALEEWVAADQTRRGKVAALNPNLPPEAMQRQWDTGDHDTRVALARNPSLPKHLWVDAARVNPNGVIAERVAADPDSPPSTLVWLIERTNKHDVRFPALANPSCPPGTMRFAWDNYSTGLVSVARLARALSRNPNVPRDVLEEMAQHRDWSVHDPARKRLAKDPPP